MKIRILAYKVPQESFATKKKNPPETGGSLENLLLLNQQVPDFLVEPEQVLLLVPIEACPEF